MTTKTLGTNANSSLTAINFGQGVSDADFATMILGIKDDSINGNPVYPGAFSRSGRIFVPGRGILQAKPGDYVAFDSTTGWPILLSALAIASGPWTHS